MIEAERILGSEYVATPFDALNDLEHKLFHPVSHLVVKIGGLLIGTDRSLVRDIGCADESVIREEGGKLQEVGSHIGASNPSSQLVERDIEAWSHLSAPGLRVSLLHPPVQYVGRLLDVGRHLKQ